jgi:hypothetical protein
MLEAMGKGARSWNRWRRDHQRKKKDRLKRQAQARSRKARAAAS